MIIRYLGGSEVCLEHVGPLYIGNIFFLSLFQSFHHHLLQEGIVYDRNVWNITGALSPHTSQSCICQQWTKIYSQITINMLISGRIISWWHKSWTPCLEYSLTPPDTSCCVKPLQNESYLKRLVFSSTKSRGLEALQAMLTKSLDKEPSVAEQLVYEIQALLKLEI